MSREMLLCLIELLKVALDQEDKRYRGAREVLFGDDCLQELLAQLQQKLEILDRIQSGDFPPMGLIVMRGTKNAKDAFKDLKIWLKDAKSLIIVDPYVFHFKKSPIFSTPEDYCDYISELLGQNVHKLTFVGNGYTTKIKNSIKNKLKEGREIRFLSSPNIHDRYIIKDGAYGKMLGTSLGGFGNKIFTILDLPSEDVEALKNIIHEMQ